VDWTGWDSPKSTSPKSVWSKIWSRPLAYGPDRQSVRTISPPCLFEVYSFIKHQNYYLSLMFHFPSCECSLQLPQSFSHVITPTPLHVTLSFRVSFIHASTPTYCFSRSYPPSSVCVFCLCFCLPFPFAHTINKPIGLVVSTVCVTLPTRIPQSAYLGFSRFASSTDPLFIICIAHTKGKLCWLYFDT
jgi:hypothetical protein